MRRSQRIWPPDLLIPLLSAALRNKCCLEFKMWSAASQNDALAAAIAPP
jgi:hypothetical protein